MLVAMVWTAERPTHAWVLTRTRAELLRREQYLLMAGVGPYLGCAVAEQTKIRDARIDVISDADERQLTELQIPAERASVSGHLVERPWIDAVWGTPAREAEDDLCDRVRSFLHYRVRKQLMWFGLNLEACKRADRRITWGLRTLVLTAAGLAIFHATLLFAGASGEAAEPELVALLAIVLPPFCTALVAVQDLFGFRKLAASYREAYQMLRRHDRMLQSLLDRLQDPTPDSAKIANDFRAAVVHAESTLTEELRRWVMLVHRPPFDATL